MWKRTRTSHKSKQNLIKKEIGQADLDMLELAAAAGDIYLKYLDESGFLIKSGIITVIVQDQGSIHTSKIVKERQDYWSSKGLYLFSLPS